MMVDGGQSEGGDVQTKDMRTEINGGASAASDPANFELKHVLQNPEGGDLAGGEEGGGGGGGNVKYFWTFMSNIFQMTSENSGAASGTFSWPWWGTPLGLAMFGGFPTFASGMEGEPFWCLTS